MMEEEDMQFDQDATSVSYKTTSPLSWWIIGTVSLSFAATLLTGLLLVILSAEVGGVLLALAASVSALALLSLVPLGLLFAVPRALEVRAGEGTDNSLVIYLGFLQLVPLKFSLSTVTLVETVDVLKFQQVGMKFSTRFSDRVRINRTQGWPIIVSPEDRDDFIKHLQTAVTIARLDEGRPAASVEHSRRSWWFF